MSLNFNYFTIYELNFKNLLKQKRIIELNNAINI